MIAVRNAHGWDGVQMKKLNIAVIGYGFMGRTHSNAFAQAPNFFELAYEPVLKTVCARRPGEGRGVCCEHGAMSLLRRTGGSWWNRDGYRPDRYRQPNNTHAEIAIAAAKAGKMVMCEKPLGRTSPNRKRWWRAVETAGVPNMVWYNYRRVPAITLAKQLIDEGRLGRIFHYRDHVPAGLDDFDGSAAGGAGFWRLDASVAGSGVTGDLLAHSSIRRCG